MNKIDTYCKLKLVTFREFVPIFSQYQGFRRCLYAKSNLITGTDFDDRNAYILANKD